MTTEQTETKHTPGPWEYAVTDQWEQCVDIFEGKTARTLARTVLNLPMPEQQANARLIAAAPALLEACQDALALLVNGVPASDTTPEEVIPALREAITKAGAWAGTPMCSECDRYPADLPSKLCCGCVAYREHTAIY